MTPTMTAQVSFLQAGEAQFPQHLFIFPVLQPHHHLGGHCWTLSSLSVSSLYWVAPNWTQHKDESSAALSGKEGSPLLC